MEQPRRQRRRDREPPPPPAAASVHHVPDDVLRLILLRLDSPLWLVRAASVCKRWLRAVAGADDGGDGSAFLRLARSLHPPDVVGHYYHRHPGGPIAFVHSSPPAPIDGRHFSLDFLPIDSSEWDVADCHRGLVLLLERGQPVADLIICNPLTRRFRQIRHPRGERFRRIIIAGAFLLDGKDGGISASNFRVIYGFSVGPRRDCMLATRDDRDWRLMWPWANVGRVAGRIDGSLCLGLLTGGVILLDNATLKFSQVDLPSLVDPSKKNYHPSYGIVHGAGQDPASPPTARIVHANGEELEVFSRRQGTGGEWVLEHRISRLSEVARGLPSYLAERPFHWAAKVVAGGVGFAVLSVMDCNKRNWLFTVNVDTMDLQFVPESTYHIFDGTSASSIYTLPWPNFMPA